MKVRVTGVLIEDGRLLLLDQDAGGGRSWSLPDLPSLGFSPRFAELARAGWPGAGSYMGAKANIGL